MSNTQSKEYQYAIQIMTAITNAVEDGTINIDDLHEGDNMTHFIHALANIVPAQYYEKITSDGKNLLEFNHIANKLCFQYMNKK